METRWLYTTSQDFPELCEKSAKTCVIPMGCIEKHGVHLPLGIDILQANRIAYMASQLETVCVFADFTFGDVPGKVPYTAPPGNITLPLETQMLLLEQLCLQIRDSGFEKILVLNGHGGNNSWLTSFSRNLVNRGYDFTFAFAHVTLPAPHKMAEILLREGSGSIPELTKEDEEFLIKCHEENLFGGHGCLGETAFMMGIYPDAVKLDRLNEVSGEYLHKTDHLSRAGINFEAWMLNFPNALSSGSYDSCNERIGKAALRIEAERVANIYKVYKEDTVLPEFNKTRTW